ncbi:hypothetical protein SELMODRAFT_228126 [Selaginella moellendorffii]|uniref:ABC transporter domain-containing protein n=1 Tax=Selaginella moellendorffii TaxID=88036 RepID=D8RNB0_SELML|nr:ABC transporter I family member 17 [Selaginella moellendorffii]EFJ26692.1 hypothetical protein SELMODRAFT_228126 [Selaginella moellendorffii]|eukprot:XP_024533115.1 ABC transporter I family member 17 [Selaginella moellendorffii]
MAHDYTEQDKDHLLNIPSTKSYPKLSVRRLSRRADTGDTILSNLSFDVFPGAVVGIIGPSGSGKSTLLRALNRLWEPPAQTIFLDGQDVTKLDVIALRRRVGMLFQTPCLFEGTVSDNVRYGPKLRGKTLEDGEVLALLQQADLDSSFADKPVHGLSVGQSQRVALARTLANRPEVLLLDEPTSSLDPVSTQNIEASLLKLCKDKSLTLVLVSHSINQVQRMADVVFLLVNGQIVEIVTPGELENASHPLARQFLDAS